eukprot:jgi/Astpho2/68/Aster-04543
MAPALLSTNTGLGLTPGSLWRRHFAPSCRQALPCRTRRRQHGACATAGGLNRDADKEESRKYRRNVFDAAQWANHRSTSRYARHLLSMPESRIVSSLGSPIAAVLLLSIGVASYETLRISFPELPDVSLSAKEPFTLTSFALSLLLVFRTNASYGRWLEGRKLWGSITNRSRDIALTYARPGDRLMLEAVPGWAAAFPYVLMCHLRDDRGDSDLRASLKASMQAGQCLQASGVLTEQDLNALMSAKHRPNYCLRVMGELFNQCSYLSENEFVRLDTQMTCFADYLGAMERIFKSPIPLPYTRHTSRFLMIWLALMPFGLWSGCRWLMVPVAGTIAFLLLGIDEIGVQLEEPFGILPLEGISSTIHANIDEMVADRKEVLELVAGHIDTNGNGTGNGSSAMASGRKKGSFGAAAQLGDG